MTPDEEAKIVKAWSEKALKLMSEHSVVPMPENYSIWFEYARGSNKKLSDAINEKIKNQEPFDHDTTRDLYNNYILKEINTKVVEDASSRVQQIMNSVLQTIEDSSSNTQTYNQDLESFSDSLENVGGEGVTEVVGQIIKKTRQLRAKGENLSRKLIASQEEVSSLRENLEEVSVQVSLDSLTGLANRKAFDDSIVRMMTEAKESGKDLCLLMVDIDHFKSFNDNFGHLLGDQVIRIVASAMKDSVKGKDFIARYGGEEFAILLPETPLHGGQIVAENVRKVIASRELKRKDTGESYGKITVSIGVSAYKRFDDVEGFIGRADKALYVSKENGRNKVTVEA